MQILRQVSYDHAVSKRPEDQEKTARLEKDNTYLHKQYQRNQEGGGFMPENIQRKGSEAKRGLNCFETGWTAVTPGGSALHAQRTAGLGVGQ